MTGHLPWLAGPGVFPPGPLRLWTPRLPPLQRTRGCRLWTDHGSALLRPPQSPPCEHVGVWGHGQGGTSASSPRASPLAVGEGGVSRLRPRVLRVTSPSPGEQAVHSTRVWLECRLRSNVQPSSLRGQGPLFWRPVVPLRITDTLRRQRKVRAGGAGGGFGRLLARVQFPPGWGPYTSVPPFAGLKREQSV